MIINIIIYRALCLCCAKEMSIDLEVAMWEVGGCCCRKTYWLKRKRSASRDVHASPLNTLVTNFTCIHSRSRPAALGVITSVKLVTKLLREPRRYNTVL